MIVAPQRVQPELITQREAIRAAYDVHESNLIRPTGLYGVDTGFHDWNMGFGGWVPSTITTLAARSRTGKTATTVQVIEAASKVVNGKRGDVLFFSWEMSARANIERFVSHSCGLTMQEYRYAKMLPESRQDDILKAYSIAKDFPVNYHQTSTNIDAVIRICEDNLKRIKGEEIEQGVSIQPIVIIDYVSMALAKSKSYGTKTNDIGAFMQEFKQYANSRGVAGFFLAQIQRTVEGEPTLSNIQDSATYEQNSDNVVIMYRPEADLVKEIRDPFTDQTVDSKDRVMWRILKTREGAPHDVLSHSDIKYFRFWHRQHKFGYDYNSLYLEDDFWRHQYGL